MVVAHAESASGTLRTVRNTTGLRDLLGSRQRPAGTRSPGQGLGSMAPSPHFTAGLNHANVRLRLWDGTACGPHGSPPEFTRARVRTRPRHPVATVVIHDRAALFSLAWQPDIAFGDGYAVWTDRRRRRPRRAPRRAAIRARPDADPSRQSATGSAACSSRRTRSTVHAQISITTTISATTSTDCGSTRKWSTPAPISPLPTCRSNRHRSPRWTISAASSG